MQKLLWGDTAYISLSTKTCSCGRDNYRCKVRGMQIVRTLNLPYRYCRADTVSGGGAQYVKPSYVAEGASRKHCIDLLHLIQMSDNLQLWESL